MKILTVPAAVLFFMFIAYCESLWIKVLLIQSVLWLIALNVNVIVMLSMESGTLQLAPLFITYTKAFLSHNKLS
jgi:hypothetical protein